MRDAPPSGTSCSVPMVLTAKMPSGRYSHHFEDDVRLPSFTIVGNVSDDGKSEHRQELWRRWLGLLSVSKYSLHVLINDVVLCRGAGHRSYTGSVHTYRQVGGSSVHIYAEAGAHFALLDSAITTF